MRSPRKPPLALVRDMAGARGRSLRCQHGQRGETSAKLRVGAGAVVLMQLRCNLWSPLLLHVK